MNVRKTLRIGLLAAMVASLLGIPEIKSAPRLTLQNPTGLYLLAEFKAALGDSNSSVELLDRALAEGAGSVSRPVTIVACGIATPSPYVAER